MIAGHTLSDFFLSTKLRVYPCVQEVLTQQKESNTLQEAMSYAVGDEGKFFRASLVLASGELFDVAPKALDYVAASVELIHGYSLIHDDLPAMDNADLRRGKPSCWKKFDEATAILAGDALLTLAFETLTDKPITDDPAVQLELVKCLSACCGPRGMVAGQMMDIKADLKSSDKLELSFIEKLQQLKTGELIRFCCESGAILANATEEDRLALRSYAQALGLIFQITDDLLDHSGQPDAIGKPTQQDTKKLNIISVLGEYATRRMLNDLQVKAQGYLRRFDDRADTLMSIIDWTAMRSH